jgi:orotate phosphoribosyltransferase
LDEIYRTARDSLETAGTEEFPSTWLIYSMVGELLRYTIEDDAIQIQNLARVLAGSAIAFSQNRDVETLGSFLKILREAVRQMPVKRKRYRFRSASGLTGVIWRAVGGTNIPVSVSSQSEVPILEEMLCNPRYVSGIVDGYTRRLAAFKKTHNIDHLCFIEKNAGPVGAIPLVSELVQRTALPAFIYRENYWLKRAQVAGVRPRENSRVAIVYDLLMSGGAIKQAVQKLRDDHQIDVVAAVVLYAYQGNRPQLNAMGPKFEVASLIDEHKLSYLAEEAVSETENEDRVIANDELFRSDQLLDEFAGADAPNLKEQTMTPDNRGVSLNGDTVAAVHGEKVPSDRWFPDTPQLGQRIRAASQFFKEASDADLGRLALRIKGQVRVRDRKNKKS